MVNNDRKKMSVRFFNEAYEAQMHGDIVGAIDLYQRSIEAFPTPEALTFLGWALSYLGKFEDAIQFCKKAIELDPEFGNPYNDIGAYLIEMNKLDEAIPFLEQATHAKRYETQCYPYYNLGRVWEKKGMIRKAMELYQKALEEEPDYRTAQESLERLKFALN